MAATETDRSAKAQQRPVRSRPLLRYHVGKWRLARWIIAHMPPHRVYVEPFAGATSVLLQKEPSAQEVLNDLNGRLVNVFRVLRDPEQAARLVQLLHLTPCSESEYRACREPADDPVEDARRMLVLGHQSHGSTGATLGKLSGWRRGDRGTAAHTAREWADLWEHVSAWADRLRGVFIECADALDVIRRWDGLDSLIYADPPYPANTRSTGFGAYGRECTDVDHRRLAGVLRSVQGMVLVSGYPCPLYDELFGDWQRVGCMAMADKNNRRMECLWLNPAAAAAAVQRDLFWDAS